MAIYVYIMASGKRDTLYTGVTSDLAARAFQHNLIEEINPEWKDLSTETRNQAGALSP